MFNHKFSTLNFQLEIAFGVDQLCFLVLEEHFYQTAGSPNWIPRESRMAVGPKWYDMFGVYLIGGLKHFYFTSFWGDSKSH